MPRRIAFILALVACAACVAAFTLSFFAHPLVVRKSPLWLSHAMLIPGGIVIARVSDTDGVIPVSTWGAMGWNSLHPYYKSHPTTLADLRWWFHLDTAISKSGGFVLEIPLWSLLLPSLAIAIAARPRSGRRAGACPACGYDLHGNVTGVCPECGQKLAT